MFQIRNNYSKFHYIFIQDVKDGVKNGSYDEIEKLSCLTLS